MLHFLSVDSDVWENSLAYVVAAINSCATNISFVVFFIEEVVAE